MTLQFVALCISLALLICMECLYLFVVSDLRQQRDRLYADNQRLMNALAIANGQFLGLKVSDKSGVDKMPPTFVPGRAPYWDSKRERKVQVGDKTVTL